MLLNLCYLIKYLASLLFLFLKYEVTFIALNVLYFKYLFKSIILICTVLAFVLLCMYFIYAMCLSKTII